MDKVPGKLPAFRCPRPGLSVAAVKRMKLDKHLQISGPAVLCLHNRRNVYIGKGLLAETVCRFCLILLLS